MSELHKLWQELSEPVICSQGGIPINDVHLKRKDAEIASLKAQLATARAEERERCAKIAEERVIVWSRKPSETVSTDAVAGVCGNIASAIRSLPIHTEEDRHG